MTIEDYISAARDLKPGDKMIITTGSKTRSNSMRVRLFKERKRQNIIDLNIVTTEIEGVNAVLLFKDHPQSAFILRHDGTKEKIIVPEKVIPRLSIEDDIENGLKRTMSLAIRDGLTLKQFTQVFYQENREIHPDDMEELKRIWKGEELKDDRIEDNNTVEDTDQGERGTTTGGAGETNEDTTDTP